MEYFVKWLGGTPKVNSRVPVEDFGDACSDMLKQFDASRSTVKKRGRPRKTPVAAASATHDIYDTYDMFLDESLNAETYAHLNIFEKTKF